ncbi:ROK family protein [soil metagenome]
MTTNQQVAIGIDLGGTNIKGVLVDADGTVINSLTAATNDKGSDSADVWRTSIFDMEEELKRFSKKPVSAIGLAAPGLPDQNNQSIAYMPGRLQGLENFNWAHFFDDNDSALSVINDGQAALMAESAFGAGQEIKNIIMLTLGTGVGGGIMINGEIYQGHIQRAGHLGHITVNSHGKQGITNMPGSLEEAIGNASLPRRSLGKFNSTMKLVEAYQKGETLATTVWLESVRNLAVGLSSLINAFSPEIIILGGGITKAVKALFDPLDEFLALYEWRPGGIKTPVKPAAFDKFAGAMGAAIYAMKTVEKS